MRWGSGVRWPSESTSFTLLLLLQPSRIQPRRVALGWEMLCSTDSCFWGAVPLLCYPKDSYGSTLPSAHPACPLKRGAGCPCGRASAPPWLLTSPASVPAWIPQPRSVLGKDITLTGSRFPWPFGLYLLFLGKGLWQGLRGLRWGLRSVFPLPAPYGLGQRWRWWGWRWGRRQRWWRRRGQRWRLPCHVDDSFDGGHHSILACSRLQRKWAQARFLASLAG